MASTSSVLDKVRATRGVYAGAHWRDVAIFVWCVRAEGATAKAATDIANELMRVHPRFSIVHVVEDTAGLPTPEGRDAFVAAAQKDHDRVACVGVLLPATSVVATLMRAFVRGVRTALRGQLKTVLEQDVAALVRNVAVVHERETGVRLNSSELTAAIAETRRLAAA